MALSSEEGASRGLGWVNAEVVKFDLGDSSLKVPHMGWNQIDQKRSCRLFDNLNHDARFYFVHSYHVRCLDQELVLTTTHHGSEFTSSFQINNIFGVQFHPEKSHKFGMKLLQNFGETVPDA
jgi:imidazole glycerol-phosphate synthase subunit HisH